MTRQEAQTLGNQFSIALAREPDEVVRNNGQSIVRLFGELENDMPEEERFQITERILHSLRIFQKVKAQSELSEEA